MAKFTLATVYLTFIASHSSECALIAGLLFDAAYNQSGANNGTSYDISQQSVATHVTGRGPQ